MKDYIIFDILKVLEIDFKKTEVHGNSITPRWLKEYETYSYYACGHGTKWGNYYPAIVIEKGVKKTNKQIEKAVKKVLFNKLRDWWSLRDFSNKSTYEFGILYAINEKGDTIADSVYNSFIKDLKTYRDTFYKEVKKKGGVQKLNTPFGIVNAGRGWMFGKDENGYKIYKKSNKDIDLHPGDIYLFLDKENIKSFRNKAKENYKKRKLQKKIKNIPLKNVYVFFKDSVNAGNCVTGTKSFCSRTKLDCKKYVRADVLLKIEDSYRVKLAIEEARKRVYLENKQGFCNLDNFLGGAKC